MIDIHSHVENFKSIPNKWVSVISRIPFAEPILQSEPAEFIIEFLIKIKNKLAKYLTFIPLFKNFKFSKADEMLEIFNKPLFKVAEILYSEMTDAGIHLSTPLMMDLGYATNIKDKAELDYGLKVDIMKRVAKKYFGEIMPFVGFDPRRPDAVDFIKFCLFEKGMLGVKMYPKLGFHPSQKSLYNSFEIDGVLADFYQMCESYKIPITMHCSSGGAYSEELVGKSDERDTLVHPSALEEVFEKYPNLYFNFAHAGGDLHLYKEGCFDIWIYYIIEYMKKYPNVFMDLAYNDKAHDEKTSKEYFKILNKLLASDIGDRIMFGTDWPMIRHTWTQKEFIAPFIKNIDKQFISKVFYQNAIKFLFPEFKIPSRILDGLSVSHEDTPVWLESKFTECKKLK